MSADLVYCVTQAAGAEAGCLKDFCPHLLVVQMVPFYYCLDKEAVFELVSICCLAHEAL